MINNKTIVFINNYLAQILLLLFFTTESISKINKYYFFENSIIPIVIKGIALCFFAVSFLLNKDKKITYLLFVIFGCFVLGQLFTSTPFELRIIVIFIKYLFPLLILFYFKGNPLSEKSRNNLFKAFESIITLNTILIILGFIFSISFFKTYSGDRFGYNGLFINSSTGTYVYVITLFYFLNKYQQKLFFKPKSIFILLGSLLVGTKAVYLSLFIIILYYLVAFIRNRKGIIFMSIVLIILMIFGYLSFFQFGIFNRIRESDGLLTTFLSYRNYNFMNNTLPYIQENWQFVNYVFGGVNDFSLKSEMGFIDLLFFFGLLGTIIYLYQFSKAFLNFKLKKIPALFLLVLISIIFIAGNFFTYSNIAIYLLIIRESFKEDSPI